MGEGLGGRVGWRDGGSRERGGAGWMGPEGWMGQRDGAKRWRADEMALRLSSLATFPEDPSLVPTIHIAARNHMSF